MEDTSYTAVYVPEYTGHPSASLIKSRIRLIRRWLFRLSRPQKSILFMIIMVLIIFSVIVTSLSWMPEQNQNRSLPDYFGNEEGKQRQQAHAVHSSSSQGISDNNNHVVQQEEPHILAQNDPVIKNTVLDANQWDGLNLAKDPPSGKGEYPLDNFVDSKNEEEADVVDEKVLVKVTSPSTSSSTTSTTTTVRTVLDLKNRIDEQVKENIRSVISLDPVIPLGPKKSKGKTGSSSSVIAPKSLMRNLKFSGPGNPRQTAVVEAFKHAWGGYRTHAMGRDHLQPISARGQDWLGLGLTLVDSLDTMYIMGLNTEFYEARDWVDDHLNFDISKNVNLFETTIRVVGGLLSAYHLSGDKIFLDKANDLGTLLFVGFKSPSGVPYSDVNLRTKEAHGPQWNPDSSTSEVSTIQLEFRDLSRQTGNPAFEGAAMNVSIILHNQRKTNGLVPIHISPKDGKLRSTSVITLGARGDSYYEYLLKQWIQTGKTIDFLRDDYLEAVTGMRDKLLRTTALSNFTYLGELDNNGQTFRPKMDHLVCYLPGTLALGYFHGLPAWHLDLAKSLLHTCYQTYTLQPTGLAPEITYFRTDGDKSSDIYVKPNDAHNLLRPETVESLWYLYQITGDKKYQDWGWEIFGSFMKYTRTPYGFTSINTVLDPRDTRPRDMMESFFLAETLKYFYLLFSDKPIFDLNLFVFNTEAHPLPVYST